MTAVAAAEYPSSQTLAQQSAAAVTAVAAAEVCIDQVSSPPLNPSLATHQHEGAQRGIPEEVSKSSEEDEEAPHGCELSPPKTAADDCQAPPSVCETTEAAASAAATKGSAAQDGGAYLRIETNILV